MTYNNEAVYFYIQDNNLIVVHVDSLIVSSADMKYNIIQSFCTYILWNQLNTFFSPELLVISYYKK